MSSLAINEVVPFPALTLVSHLLFFQISNREQVALVSNLGTLIFI